MASKPNYKNSYASLTAARHVYGPFIMENVKLILLVGEMLSRFPLSKSVSLEVEDVQLITSSLRFKFKCQRCGILKTQDCYSNKEIGSYKATLALNPGMKPHPIESYLKCRACKDSQLSELKCCGPCTMVKPLGQFSKSQRKGAKGVCSPTLSFSTVVIARTKVYLIVVYGMYCMEGIFC